MLLKQDKRPAHVRSTGQRYNKNRTSAAFVCGKCGCDSKNDLLEGIVNMLFKLQTAYRRQINSAFPRYCFHWPRAACPATARTGGERSWFSCRCPCACIQHNRFCPFFSKKFNTISAHFINQSPTLPQKINSRGGLF